MSENLKVEMMMNLNFHVSKWVGRFFLISILVSVSSQSYAVGDLWLDSNLNQIPAESRAKAHLYWNEDEENRDKSAPIYLQLQVRVGRKGPHETFRFGTTRANVQESQVGPESYVRTTLEPLKFEGGQTPFKIMIIRSERNFIQRGLSTNNHYRSIVQKVILFRDNESQASVPFGELREEYIELLFREDLVNLHNRKPTDQPWRRGDGLPYRRTAEDRYR